MNTTETVTDKVVSKLVNLRWKAEEAIKDPFRATSMRHVSPPVFVAAGVELDPNRPLSKFWKPTPYDGRSLIIDNSRPADQRIDAGDGFGRFIDGHPPYKIRHLRRPRLGEVQEVSSIEYYQCRMASQDNPNPPFEPVPDSTPVSPRLFPADMPTDYAKAQRVAGKHLKKAPEELTIQEIIKFYRERKTINEILKAA